MSLSKTVEQQLNLAKIFHNFVVEAFPEGTYPGILRNDIFVALSNLVLEHHGAILTLVESAQHYGSAFALLRPIFETSHRAFWTLYCAKDDNLTLIVQGAKCFPSLTDCSLAVDKYFAGQGHPDLFAMSKQYLNQLHGFTHSGIEQLQFRFNSDLVVVPTFPDKPLCTLIQQASMVLAMTQIAHLQLVEGPSIGDSRVTAKYQALFGRPGE